MWTGVELKLKLRGQWTGAECLAQPRQVARWIRPVANTTEARKDQKIQKEK